MHEMPVERRGRIEKWAQMWKFSPNEDSKWRVFKALKWMDAHDLNGDGQIDKCELAQLLKF